MGLYDYERDLSNLSDKYNQDNATNEYARFVSQQRFARDRGDATRNYQRAFPQFTGQYAHQLGSGVHSGVFGDKLNQFVGDQNRSMDRMNEDQAGYDSNYAQNQANHEGSYQKALLQLQEEAARQRAMTDPFASYRSVYPNG